MNMSVRYNQIETTCMHSSVSKTLEQTPIILPRSQLNVAPSKRILAHCSSLSFLMAETIPQEAP